MSKFRARGCDRAKVIRVIQTEALAGAGVEGDPVRCIVQYWDFHGNLLATGPEYNAEVYDE